MKPILDVTCGGRMMWFDKHNPACLYIDNRELQEAELCDGRKFSVNPDVIADFTSLPFEDNSFYLVVFDPPHLVRAGDDAYMVIKYGKLPAEWPQVIHDGFLECMRVLKPNGTLIFKWNEYQIPTREVIKVIGQQPLFGQRSGRASKTHWMTFMKIPKEESTNA
jgi:23S rRNA G2069 N7-methylase RlmK/C1962 C5-methylase RlmI